MLRVGLLQQHAGGVDRWIAFLLFIILVRSGALDGLNRGSFPPLGGVELSAIALCASM